MSDIYPITLCRYNELEDASLIDPAQIYQIYDNDDEIAKELITTRKALDVAVDALKRIADAPIGYCMFAEEALEQITALEQKDNKCVK